MSSPLIRGSKAALQLPVNTGMFKPRRTLHAVNGVDLRVERGEVLGIVGESGCGKSTLARMLLGPDAAQQRLGQHRRPGHHTAWTGAPWRDAIQPVFQDPYSSLNPRRNNCVHRRFAARSSRPGHADERRKKAIEMLERVGLPARHADSTPGQLSGGQRQRVAIARALVMQPEIVICDEPTSALDVSVQAQILNLLMDLRREFNLTYVFISHNLAVVEHIATHVAVMYLGRVVEFAETATLFHNPRHPYTQALLASVLTPETGPGHTRHGAWACRFPTRSIRRQAARFIRAASNSPCRNAASIAPSSSKTISGAVACHLYPHTRFKDHSHMNRANAISEAQSIFDSGQFRQTLARRIAIPD